MGLYFVLPIFTNCLVGGGVLGAGWLGAGGIKIKTKLGPQLGLAKLELGLSLATPKNHR